MGNISPMSRCSSHVRIFRCWKHTRLQWPGLKQEKCGNSQRSFRELSIDVCFKIMHNLKMVSIICVSIFVGTEIYRFENGFDSKKNSDIIHDWSQRSVESWLKIVGLAKRVFRSATYCWIKSQNTSGSCQPTCVIFCGIARTTLGRANFNVLVWGKNCRKPLIFPLIMGFSCKFSLQPIHW